MRPTSIFRMIRRGLALLGALILLVTLLPPYWYVTWIAGPWSEPTEGVLIVLGGDSVDGTMLGQSAYLRSVYAVWIWQQGHFHHLLLSGPPDATSPMILFMKSQGIPASAILREQASQNTHENAEFAQPILRGLPGPYVLATSDYHMLRARRAFAKAGLTVQPRPLPDAAKRLTRIAERWTTFLDLSQEACKIAYYWVRGWI